MRGHLEVGQGGVCTLCIAPAPGAVGLLAAGSNDDVGFEVVHGAVCSGRVHGLGQGSHRGGVRQVGQEQVVRRVNILGVCREFSKDVIERNGMESLCVLCQSLVSSDGMNKLSLTNVIITVKKYFHNVIGNFKDRSPPLPYHSSGSGW